MVLPFTFLGLMAIRVRISAGFGKIVETIFLKL